MAPSYNPEERVWIQRAREGEQAAFSYLVEAYQRPVYNLCFRMLGDPAAAEDAAQETFLKAYKSINRFDGERRFVNWLLAIASHYCIDQMRRRRPVLVGIDEAEIGDPGPTGPEQSLMQAEANASLQALMARLDPTDRAAVVLHYWHDLSLEDIGRTLKLSESAVKSRLHRARRALATGWSVSRPAPADGTA